MQSQLKKIVIGNLIVIFIGILVFSCNKLYHLMVDVVETKEYYVHSKYWKASQQECEDYQEYVCRTVTNCRRSSNGDRICEDKTKCSWETKTRILNTWVRDGYYPDKPKYTEHYPIPSNHYEKKWIEYWIYFRSNNDTFDRYTRDEDYYNSFNIGDVYKADFNYFGVIVNLYK